MEYLDYDENQRLGLYLDTTHQDCSCISLGINYQHLASWFKLWQIWCSSPCNTCICMYWTLYIFSVVSPMITMGQCLLRVQEFKAVCEFWVQDQFDSLQSFFESESFRVIWAPKRGWAHSTVESWGSRLQVLFSSRKDLIFVIMVMELARFSICPKKNNLPHWHGKSV